MSRTLARIRDAIGDPVFVRSGRGLAPTPRALELREQVRGVVEQAHAIFTSGREVDLRTLERTFSLCTNDVFAAPTAASCATCWPAMRPIRCCASSPRAMANRTTTPCRRAASTCVHQPHAQVCSRHQSAKPVSHIHRSHTHQNGK